jgi:hypothetical protein
MDDRMGKIMKIYDKLTNKINEDNYLEYFDALIITIRSVATNICFNCRNAPPEEYSSIKEAIIYKLKSLVEAIVKDFSLNDDEWISLIEEVKKNVPSVGDSLDELKSFLNNTK